MNGTLGIDATILLWDVMTGTRIGQPLHGPSDMTDVAFSPDGSLLAGTDIDGGVLLWDARDQPKIEEISLGGVTGQPWSLEFSPDGRSLVIATDDGTVVVWDVQTKTQAGIPLRGCDGWVREVSFSPDGRFIAGGCNDGTVAIWNAPTEVLSGSPDWIWDAAFDPSRNMLGAGGVGDVTLWDLATGGPIAADPVRRWLDGHRARRCFQS